MDHDEMRNAMRRAQQVTHTDPDGRFTLWNADCVEAMRTMPDASVDAIVADPPYELGFMGKTWDAAGVAYSVELWREALRVLKPGGHLLAFGGTRTYHRMACAIEDAGFEIRDSIHWVYGSGFPKSLDVSKAIDKMDAKTEQEARRYRFTAWVRSTGVTAKQVDEATGTNMGGHYTTNASQPAIMTREHLETCRHLLGDIPEWVEREADIRSVESRNFAAREVVGTSTHMRTTQSWETTSGMLAPGEKTISITTPATDAAKQWNGWGTALKPAHEPIVVARKPLIGTVAQNVLTHGTGALNIDATRVPAADGVPQFEHKGQDAANCYGNGLHGSRSLGTRDYTTGRWPANVIHDGSDEVVARFPDGTSGKPSVAGRYGEHEDTGGNAVLGRGLSSATPNQPPRGDSGSAARFFPALGHDATDEASFMYCAKPGKKERNAGLEGLPERPGGSNAKGYTADVARGIDRNRPVANHHPTVKPIALMRWLIRLVTPPGGIVLDPFLGSGTTAVAALLEGKQAWGCEMTDDYIPIIMGRIEWAIAQVESTIEGTR